MFAETAMLLMVEGSSPGKRVFLEKPELLIGRDERCDLVIPDRRVSRHHARISLEGDGYILTDLGSRNGTFVNGVRLVAGRAFPVVAGDSVVFGTIQCRFEIDPTQA